MSEERFVIVGGSHGIGLGLVQRLVADGARVTVFSRTSDQISGMDGVEHVAFDVLSDDYGDRMPEQIKGLAYCPGSINLRSFRSLSPDTFREDFELNVVGAVNAVQAALKGLKQVDRSSVLMFSTVAVGQGMFAHASVAAAKGAVEGLARTLASELAPGIRVNCIAPALTETPLTEKFFSTDEKSKSMAEKYPLQRTGTIDDLAAAGHFLLSDRSGWITGQVLGVDGGMSTLR